MSAYGSSTVNRQRRTRAELDAIDDAITEAVAADSPVTLRGTFHRVVSAGAVAAASPALCRAYLRRHRAAPRPGCGLRISPRPPVRAALPPGQADPGPSARPPSGRGWHERYRFHAFCRDIPAASAIVG